MVETRWRRHSGDGALAGWAAPQFRLVDGWRYVSLVEASDVGSRGDNLIDPVQYIVGRRDVYPGE